MSAEVFACKFVVVFPCIQLALFSGVHEFINKMVNFILVTNITARKKRVKSCKRVELITDEIDIVCRSIKHCSRRRFVEDIRH